MARLQVVENTDHPGGYAIIVLPCPLHEPAVTFTIERIGADKPYLGHNGWQTQMETLSSSQIVPSAENTEVHIGPDIVDHINDDWRILIRFPSLDLSETIFWPSIVHSGLSQRATALAAADTTHLTKTSSRKPLKASQAESVLAVAADVQSPPDLTDIQPVTSSERSRSPMLFGALGVAALLMAIAVGVYLSLGKKNDTNAQIPPQPEASAVEASNNAQVPGPQNSGAESAPRNRRADLQALINSAAPRDIFLFGKEALGAGDRDVGYLAVDISQQRGHAEAILQVGRWYDPRYFEAEKMFSRPNIEQAARYYKRALSAGLSEGGDELRGLCSVLSRDPPTDPDLEREAQSVLSTMCQS